MLEQQFIQFTTDKQEGTPILPFVPGMTGLEFYTPDPLIDNNGQGVTISLITPDGTAEYASTVVQPTSRHVTIGADSTGLFPKAALLSTMGYGSVFRIKYRYQKTSGPASPLIVVQKFSQILVMTENKGNRLALLRYRCGNTTGGIPYLNGEYVSAWMPIWLDKPQFKQSSEIYTRLDGSNAVLYATTTKEYEAQTDYLPLEWHEKIVNALMSDNVTINGEELQKSEDYEIKWEQTQTIRNKIKLAKATWKMKACTLTRNTNS